ncbi:hypothetical protein MLD38_036488 [Melastoma candidum]|uniref:Uncharacterized protein n=1 Tax=Melastoma candidum TaxID=119954 RepID=A0ACB9LJC9_9MYRT|nr:hypothetical protein MLD38_036488 [Melastoma candidum]
MPSSLHPLPYPGDSYYECETVLSIEEWPTEKMTPEQLVWLYTITLTFIGLKIILRKNCRRSGSITVRLFAEEHSELLDVVGLVMTVLGDRFYWLLEINPDVRVGEVAKLAPPRIKTTRESTAVESSSSRSAPQQHFGSIQAVGRDIEEG